VNGSDKENGSKIAANVAVVLLVALVLQSLHEIEHIAQFYQHWWLGLGAQEAHGILFFLDVEWNHFIFNAVYFFLLAVIFFFLLFYPEFRSIRQQRIGRIAFGFFVFGFLLQGYHVIEHTVRMGQFFQLGCTPCPGILGWYIDLVYLHFTINSATLLLPAAILPVLWRKGLLTSERSHLVSSKGVFT